MEFTDVKYVKGQGGGNFAIQFTLNGQVMSVGLNAVGNVHFDEIQRQVAAGTLAIQEAD